MVNRSETAARSAGDALRCLTCGDTAHPGYVAWRDIDLGNGLFRRSLAPCPDCRGSIGVPVGGGTAFGHRDVLNVVEPSTAAA